MKLKNTKLREGDEVIVISGKEKGKRGNIKQIIGSKCVINDLNLAKRHTRPNPQLGYYWWDCRKRNADRSF